MQVKNNNKIVYVYLFIFLLASLFVHNMLSGGELHKYAAEGDLQKVKEALEVYDINAKNEYDETALHCAVEGGLAMLFYILLKMVQMLTCEEMILTNQFT